MTSTADREIILTRLIAAPRALVFAAFTDPVHIDKWWGPRGFANETLERDVRVGGLWRYMMRSAEHGEFPNRVEYTEVVAPERLVYRHGTDEQPDQFRVTITFADEGGKTRLTMRSVFPRVEDVARVKEFGAVDLGNSNLDRFEEFLAGDGADAPADEPVLRLTRVFRAPRALVWQAWTEAEHLTKWFGPKGFTMVSASFELRVGGVFHYRMRPPAGHPMGNAEMWGKFVFHEIVAPERLVFVNSFSNEAGEVVRAPMSATWPLEVLNTYTFSEQDGRTTLQAHSTPYQASAAELATFAGAKAGVRQGSSGMLDQLTAYLARR